MAGKTSTRHVQCCLRADDFARLFRFHVSTRSSLKTARLRFESGGRVRELELVQLAQLSLTDSMSTVGVSKNMWTIADTINFRR